jgi:hypothetical protein
MLYETSCISLQNTFLFSLNFWRRIFFLNLIQPVYKM